LEPYKQLYYNILIYRTPLYKIRTCFRKDVLRKDERYMAFVK